MRDQDHPLADYPEGYLRPLEYRTWPSPVRLVPITGMDAPNVISLAQKRAERAAIKSSDRGL
jgi:hypothetical protein